MSIKFHKEQHKQLEQFCFVLLCLNVLSYRCNAISISDE